MKAGVQIVTGFQPTGLCYREACRYIDAVIE